MSYTRQFQTEILDKDGELIPCIVTYEPLNRCEVVDVHEEATGYEVYLHLTSKQLDDLAEEAIEAYHGDIEYDYLRAS